MAEITHDEARAIAHRFIDGHFRNKGEGPRVSIPARPEYDDDLRLTDYIDQQTAVDSELAELRVALAEVDMILGVVGADRDCRRMLLCAMRARTKAVEAERDEARAERDARPAITRAMARVYFHEGWGGFDIEEFDPDVRPVMEVLRLFSGLDGGG